MNDEESLIRLKRLETESAMIRRRLGITPPNVVIFRASVDSLEDKDAVIVADGFGGAMLSIVEGNYPIDFLSLQETKFTTERAAIKEAERLTHLDQM